MTKTIHMDEEQLIVVLATAAQRLQGSDLTLPQAQGVEHLAQLVMHLAGKEYVLVTDSYSGEHAALFENGENVYTYDADQVLDYTVERLGVETRSARLWPEGKYEWKDVHQNLSDIEDES
jgi:hypothetical protein